MGFLLGLLILLNCMLVVFLGIAVDALLGIRKLLQEKTQLTLIAGVDVPERKKLVKKTCEVKPGEIVWHE